MSDSRRIAKHIFVTGGVVSSVGKGVTVAAIGRLLKSRGIRVSIQKLDPYFNVDPGTMSPYQHGEVFVTEDGAETDLDLGHYERFIDEHLTRESNVTSGQVFEHVIEKERRGDYLGGTVQMIPHVTDEIRERILRVGETTNADVVIVEVGGTVGDIESLPFIESIRQLRRNLGRENVFYIHVTLLPYIGSTGELKTKPTQHSVHELRRLGIQPEMIICRSDFEMPPELREKIALFCDVDEPAVIPPGHLCFYLRSADVPGKYRSRQFAGASTPLAGTAAGPSRLGRDCGAGHVQPCAVGDCHRRQVYAVTGRLPERD